MWGEVPRPEDWGHCSRATERGRGAGALGKKAGARRVLAATHSSPRSGSRRPLLIAARRVAPLVLSGGRPGGTDVAFGSEES